MRIRSLIVAAALVGALVLGWSLRERGAAPGPPTTAAGLQDAPQSELRKESKNSPRVQTPPSVPAASPDGSAAGVSDSPVDVAARARFNEKARAFFARAADLPPEERMHKAQHIDQELSRLEQAGGMSAGEIFLLRAGLIRETVPDPAEQVAQIKALKERYENEAQRRMAQANARPDPAFDLYKVREREIVAEVMAMETIP